MKTFVTVIILDFSGTSDVVIRSVYIVTKETRGKVVNAYKIAIVLIYASRKSTC